MNKFIIIIFCLFFSVSHVFGQDLESLWNKYNPAKPLDKSTSVKLKKIWNKYNKYIPKQPTPVATGDDNKQKKDFPGIILENKSQEAAESFNYPWKYRDKAFEIYYGNPANLAKNIYSLALYAKDVGPELPREKFYKGVQGFHYSLNQITGWLNEQVKDHKAFSPDDIVFIELLLNSGVIKKNGDLYESTGKVNHVLGSAPGKKRGLEQNLLHERLHVFWDEDEAMRDKWEKAWNNMGKEEKEAAKKKLKNYAQDNERQLLEEWAIANEEKNGLGVD